MPPAFPPTPLGKSSIVPALALEFRLVLQLQDFLKLQSKFLLEVKTGTLKVKQKKKSKCY